MSARRRAPRRGAPAVPEELCASDVVVDGERYVVLGFRVAGASADGIGVEGLTPAERQVLALLLEGRTASEIAARRSTSPRTVANQLASIYRKLGVQGRRELIARLRSAL
jgi:DNA-binding CsgD family transcriptional regulator